jgi:hypothetical protein
MIYDRLGPESPSNQTEQASEIEKKAAAVQEFTISKLKQLENGLSPEEIKYLQNLHRVESYF